MAETRKTAAELLEEYKKTPPEPQPQENAAATAVDAEARMRFKCVHAVMEFGSEMDRRNPIPKANEIFNYVIGKEPNR